LQRILSLRADYVKLDIALVRGIDSDPARQALVAGMVHFARRTHSRLLAEGVETRAEADALLGLGAELGQGFLFGRPEPVGHIVVSESRV
jgi:EAL domain-containing protein (putative c-di-GMP-specific phosphodiesterase class I)